MTIAIETDSKEKNSKDIKYPHYSRKLPPDTTNDNGKVTIFAKEIQHHFW